MRGQHCWLIGREEDYFFSFGVFTSFLVSESLKTWKLGIYIITDKLDPVRFGFQPRFAKMNPNRIKVTRYTLSVRQKLRSF